MVQKLLGTEHTNSQVEDLPFFEHLYEHASNERPSFAGHSDGKDEFDGLKEWNHCPSVRKIRNQGKCAGDWVSKIHFQMFLKLHYCS